MTCLSWHNVGDWAFLPLASYVKMMLGVAGQCQCAPVTPPCLTVALNLTVLALIGGALQWHQVQSTPSAAVLSSQPPPSDPPIQNISNQRTGKLLSRLIVYGKKKVSKLSDIICWISVMLCDYTELWLDGSTQDIKPPSRFSVTLAQSGSEMVGFFSQTGESSLSKNL